MKHLLEIQGVSKYFATHKALDMVSLTVPEGSIFGLLGPNGAGKTSLIRIINQISTPDTGSVFFDGQLLNPEHIYQIGYLPEERGLYKKQKVWDQVLYFGQLKGLTLAETKSRAVEWLKKFDLVEWRNKKVEELSKGMQQKVQFIITVLHRPRLLILDEPFTGFDPINAELLKQEILKLREEGTTVLYSTHRMESVEELCDSICLINKSKKILEGRVSDIKAAYSRNLFELEFEGDLPAWVDVVEATPTLGNRKKITFKNAIGSPSDAIRKLASEVNIWSFREVVPTIHQIFIQNVEEVNHA